MACPTHLPDDLTESQLNDFPAFKTWKSTLQRSLSLQARSSHPFHKSPYQLRSISVQSCDWFGKADRRRLGFVKLKADISNEEGEYLPGAVFLRGGSVAILIILKAKEERHVLLTVQPRIAAGSLEFVELPAGMLDDAGSFSGGAAKEIQEETGLEVRAEDLIDLTALALKSERNEEGLQNGVYASPGGSDEFIPIMLYSKDISAEQLESFKGKLTGLRDHGEKITLKVVSLDDVWRVGARDAKTLAALALYEALHRRGEV